MALCEKISEKCYILGEKAWHRPGLLKDEEVTENFKSSGVVYKLEQMNTVSDVLKCAKKMEGKFLHTEVIEISLYKNLNVDQGLKYIYFNRELKLFLVIMIFCLFVIVSVPYLPPTWASSFPLSWSLSFPSS